MKGGDFEYKLYRKGQETGRGGVGLMVKHDLVESVMEVRRVSPRTISIDIVVNKKAVTVISVYAPQSGRNEEEKEKFYEDLTAEVQSRHGTCFVLGQCFSTFCNSRPLLRVLCSQRPLPVLLFTRIEITIKNTTKIFNFK